MIDCFALLEQPRQPWLDVAVLQEQFTALATQQHPDKVVTTSEAERRAAASRFAELNSAYQTLRDPKSRLAHLLELETGAAPGQIQAVSGADADLFFRVSSLCREADGFLGSRSPSTSPLVKAGVFAQALEWTERLQSQQHELAAQLSALDARIRALNAAWKAGPSNEAAADPAAPPSPLKRLETIYRQLSFLTRWHEQLQERVVQLAE